MRYWLPGLRSGCLLTAKSPLEFQSAWRLVLGSIFTALPYAPISDNVPANPFPAETMRGSLVNCSPGWLFTELIFRKPGICQSAGDNQFEHLL